MELNGFKIERFNIHNLPENVKSSTCPLCSHDRKKKADKCLTINWEKGLANCWHCGEVIQLHEFKKSENKQVKEYTSPNPLKKVDLSDNVIKWFAGRKISQQTLKTMKITEGKEWMPQTKKEMNTIQFPYYKAGKLVNIKYRDGNKNFKLVTGAEKIFYNLDMAHISDEIIIVEGEIDVLSYIEADVFNVVSVPNGSPFKGSVNLDYLDKSIEYFENKTKIYLALDKDEAGQNVQKEMIRRFGSHRCYTVDLSDCKDANEFLQKYGKDKLKQTITEAKQVPIQNVSGAMDWEQELEDYLINGMKQGYKTGIKSLDDVFTTYTKQYIVVTGIPSCFSKEQLIHTSTGVKEISKLQKGDMVLSYSHEKRINEFKKVINTLSNKKHKGKMLKIKMKDGTIIKVTDDHRFFTGSQYLQIKKLLVSLEQIKNKKI